MGATYEQYPNGSPQQLSYLSGAVMPWDDYYFMRISDTTSIAVYGQSDGSGYFDDCTVRTVVRDTSGYSNTYDFSEFKAEGVTVVTSYPATYYSNVDGINYNLPAANNVMSCAVCISCLICAVMSVFRLFFSLRREGR